MKIVLMQRADSFLAAPLETVSALLIGLLAFLCAALLMIILGPQKRWALMRPIDDPEFMAKIGSATAILAIALVVIRSLLSGDSVDDGVMGDAPASGVAIGNYLKALMPFSVAVFTARSMLLSSRRRAVDLRVALVLAIGVIIGLLTNSRTEMLNGFVACGCTYLVYGGKVRILLLTYGLVLLAMVDLVIFPLIDIQRGLPKGLSSTEYVAETLHLGMKIVTGQDEDEAQALFDTYSTWTSRQYYGKPTGFLDRFTPNQLDEVVFYVGERGTSNSEGFTASLLRFIPNLIYRFFNIDPQETGGILIQRELHPFSVYSSPNYGLMAEVYLYFGPAWSFLVLTIILFVAFEMLYFVYGGLSRSYLGAYCVTTYLFVIADSTLSELIARTVEQGGLYVILYTIACLAWSTGTRGQPKPAG